MLHDPKRSYERPNPPLFRGFLFVAAMTSAALMLADFLLWVTGNLPLRVFELKMLALTPAFVFFTVAWLMRWRGFGWRWVWITFFVLAALGLLAAYNGYVASLDAAFRALVP